MRQLIIVLGVLAAVFVSGAKPAFAQTTLAGACIYSCESTGSASGGQFWNTLGGDFPFNLWIVQNGTPASAFVNGPTDGNAGISVPLSPGTYTYYIFGEPGEAGDPTGSFALNLFFNGNTTNPGISVFAPIQTSAAPPGHLVNSSTFSKSLHDTTGLVAAAGSSVYGDSGMLVTLTRFEWAHPQVHGLDRVSALTTGASGATDFVGRFDLTVSTVPEPDALALFLPALAAIALVSKKRWS